MTKEYEILKIGKGIEDFDSSKLTNIEVAIEFAKHIQNPCSTNVNGVEVNIREFHIREARKVIPTFENPYAADFLNAVISAYSS